MYIYIYIYITRVASNEIFSSSNKIHLEVGWAKDLSAPVCCSRQTGRDFGTRVSCVLFNTPVMLL